MKSRYVHARGVVGDARAALAKSCREANHAAGVLIEAENFSEKGGWVVDQQFMDQMGSPFLLAHGFGRPVADAVTKAEIPAGATHVWVRTRHGARGRRAAAHNKTAARRAAPLPYTIPRGNESGGRPCGNSLFFV